MTAAPKRVCPSWCTDGPECLGLNCSTDSLTVGATGENSRHDASPSGVFYPGVSVRGGRAERDVQPIVCLHLGDVTGNLDDEVFLRPSEATELIENLQLIIGQIKTPT